MGGVYGADLVKFFKDDIKTGGDLHSLTLGEPWKKEIADIEARLA